MSDFRDNSYSEIKQIYNPQTGQFEMVSRIEPEPKTQEAAELHAAASADSIQQDMPEPADLPAVQESAANQDAFGMQRSETEIRRDGSGGSTVVDFEYDKYAAVEKKASDTDSVAALVLGILSIVLNLFAALIAVILGVFGIIFAVKGRRNPEKRSMATAGLVCSVIGLVIGVLAMIAAVIFIGWIAADIADPGLVYEF